MHPEDGPFTLWRNDTLLAKLVLPLPHDDPRDIGGMIDPTEEFGDVGEMLQSAPELEGTRRVMVSRDFERSNGRPFPLRRLSDAAAEGLAAGQQLQLRDGSGVVVPAESIGIMATDIPDRGPFAEACAAAGLTGSGWMLIARRGSGDVPRSES